MKEKVATMSNPINVVDNDFPNFSLTRPEWRGLLASPNFWGQPVKGAYFFAGERRENASTYTSHPLDARDEHWNSVEETRVWVMDRLVRAHVNTVVMSYWSNMPQWSPMKLEPESPTGVDALKGVLDAVQNRPLVIMPAIESGFDPDHPEIPHWVFSSEFPITPGSFELAPGLVKRIGWLVELFNGRMNLWARMYDRDGQARYAVNLIHVYSSLIERDTDNADEIFAQAFDKVAKEVEIRYHIPIGFTLDAISSDHYAANPHRAGAALERTASVLAIQGFASEVFSGRVNSAPPCKMDWQLCQPIDNNLDNLENLFDWKRAAAQDWVRTGVPVILDVSNGFDGRIIWKNMGAGFWGDNLDYTDDRWRNWLSQLKGEAGGIKGITFNTWNGYTEGYSAAPTREHGWTVYNWLTDLFEPPPWDYSHMHYVNGARTHRVYGAICEKWIQLGADRGFGAPVSEELPSTLGRMQHFTGGKMIYWSGFTGAHELHGLIAKTYREENGDASCLGLPISDEVANGAGRVVYFQHGRIDWFPGDARGRITCW